MIWSDQCHLPFQTVLSCSEAAEQACSHNVHLTEHSCSIGAGLSALFTDSRISKVCREKLGQNTLLLQDSCYNFLCEGPLGLAVCHNGILWKVALSLCLPHSHAFLLAVGEVAHNLPAYHSCPLQYHLYEIFFVNREGEKNPFETY